MSNVPEGAIVRFFFYLVPPSAADPVDHKNLPHRPLFSLKLRTRGWLLVMVGESPFAPDIIDRARIAGHLELGLAGKILTPEQQPNARFCFFVTPAPGAPHGVIEVCLI